MSQPLDRHLGPAAYDPPGYINAHFGIIWQIRCYPCGGDQYWSACRHQPAPEGARRFGVADEFAAWTLAPAVWDWLSDQQTAWQRWQAAHRSG